MALHLYLFSVDLTCPTRTLCQNRYLPFSLSNSLLTSTNSTCTHQGSGRIGGVVAVAGTLLAGFRLAFSVHRRVAAVIRGNRHTKAQLRDDWALAAQVRRTRWPMTHDYVDGLGASRHAGEEDLVTND